MRPVLTYSACAGECRGSNETAGSSFDPTVHQDTPCKLAVRLGTRCSSCENVAVAQEAIRIGCASVPSRKNVRERLRSCHSSRFMSKQPACIGITRQRPADMMTDDVIGSVPEFAGANGLRLPGKILRDERQRRGTRCEVVKQCVK